MVSLGNFLESTDVLLRRCGVEKPSTNCGWEVGSFGTNLASAHTREKPVQFRHFATSSASLRVWTSRFDGPRRRFPERDDRPGDVETSFCPFSLAFLSAVVRMVLRGRRTLGGATLRPTFSPRRSAPFCVEGRSSDGKATAVCKTVSYGRRFNSGPDHQCG